MFFVVCSCYFLFFFLFPLLFILLLPRFSSYFSIYLACLSRSPVKKSLTVFVSFFFPCFSFYTSPTLLLFLLLFYLAILSILLLPCFSFYISSYLVFPYLVLLWVLTKIYSYIQLIYEKKKGI